jgi:hypothetical protein
MPGIIVYGNPERTREKLAQFNRQETGPRFSVAFQAIPNDTLFEEISRLVAPVEELYVQVDICGETSRGAKEEDSLPLDMLLRLPNITNLTLISGWRCDSLEPLASLPKMTRIDMNLGYLKKRSLLPLADSQSLRSVTFRGHSTDLADTLRKKEWNDVYLEEVKRIAAPGTVTCDTLGFGACPKEVIEGFCKGRARVIHIAASKSFADLSIVERLSNLKSVHLSELPNIMELNFGRAAAGIENLWVENLNGLRLSESLEKLKKLRYLRLTGCSSISRQQLVHLKKLSKLVEGRVVIKDRGEWTKDLVKLNEILPIEQARRFSPVDEVDPNNYDPPLNEGVGVSP